MPEAIDLNRYAPYFVVSIANRWTSSSSRLYFKKFGIGITEARVLLTLRALGTMTSLEMANFTSMDPAAVSRAMNRLQKKQHVEPVPGRYLGRIKPFRLSKKGIKLSDEIRPIALQREGMLLQDLSDEERETLLGFFRKIHGRLAEL